MAATVSCAVCRIEQSKPRWGPFEVRRAKVRDRGDWSAEEKMRLTRRICRSGYSRRIGSMRCCRLRGVSTGDFQKALAALLGKDAPNLSPAVISRLTAEWQADYDAWQKRDLSARRYVYVWADGVYLQARMEEAAECMLVLAGATPEGKKELVGFQTGVREGARSWRELLIDIKQRARDCAAPGGRRARPLEGDRGGLSEHQAPVAVGFTRPPTC
jgi:putative transposase